MIQRLTLTQFRSYANLIWRPAAQIAVLTGPNGSGKTNLLEAISLLAPGRGLRNVRLAELQREGADIGWGVAARLNEAELATGAHPDWRPAQPADRRVFRLNGQAPRNQAEIASEFATLWLTPQMDRLFQEGASSRRRFLDRLVWTLEPGHAREVSAYETAMSGRNRLLAQEADAAWITATEDSMARHAVAATAARAALIDRLNPALERAGGTFPAARLTLLDPIADRLRKEPALVTEDWLRTALADNRPRDRAAGSSGIGAHRADLAMEDAATGRPAARASTGQQKALLISVVLGHAALITSARGSAPLLLLDEPAVHLDAQRRAELWRALIEGSAQVLLTGTDPEPFAPLRGVAEGLLTGEGQLRPDPWFGEAKSMT